jgi:hypothetical protein
MTTSNVEKEMGNRLGDILRYETPMDYCRKVCKLAKSMTVVIGTALDRDESSGAIVVLDSYEANCDAIALQAVTTGSGATGTVLALVRGPAVIDTTKIVLQTSQVDADRDTIAAALLTATGIVGRREATLVTNQGVMAG